MPGTGNALQLLTSRRLQPNELDVEDESRVGWDDFTKTTGT